MNNKKSVRNHILEIRDNISKEDKVYLDGRLKNRVLSLDIIREAPVVFAYVSFKSEVDTHQIIESLISRGQRVAVPKIQDGVMMFYEIHSMDDLESGTMGILEPIVCEDEIVPQMHDVILVPGVVFDKRLYRIGYGGGFYDKYMAVHKNIKTVGLAYDIQIVDSIAIEPWDRGVDIILTEKQMITY